MDLLLGQEVPLALQLSNGATNKFPRAKIYDESGTELAGSPVVLTHVSAGLYKASSFVMPAKPFIVAQYLIYSDAGFTTLDPDYPIASDAFSLLTLTTLEMTRAILFGTVEKAPIIVGTLSASQLYGEISEEC
jgi:hypothetical protein